jgi:acetyl esterase/lipase
MPPVVLVNYTPSPEAKYPVPIEEAYAATKYCAAHGGELNLDGGRLAVAGDSVGVTASLCWTSQVSGFTDFILSSDQSLTS